MIWRNTSSTFAARKSARKKELLAVAKKYPANHTLMIGDAPGDYKAAQAQQRAFFPINPGAEEASWKRFHDEGIDRFLTGKFAGEYQQKLLAEFDSYLPGASAVGEEDERVNR